MEERKTIWEQLVDQKDRWIGGTLTEYADKDAQLFGAEPVVKTKIKDIVFRKNPPDGMWFEVEGENFGCGFDTRNGGISGEGGHDLRFGGPYGLNFGIDLPK